MHRRTCNLALSTVAVLGASLTSAAQPRAVAPDLARLVDGSGGAVSNRVLTSIRKDGEPAVRLDEREGDGLAYWPDLGFSDGTIELDIRGRDLPGRSFVGVAFHGLDESTYDVVYFRPFNFHAEDPARRAHAVQYVAHPAYTWRRLRSEHPETYESSLSPAPDPDDWFHVRVVVAHPKLRVFVDGRETPSLEVEQLSERKAGWVGFWVGNGSDGSFANLELTPGE